MAEFYSDSFSSTLLSRIPGRGAGLNIVSGYVSSSAIYWALSRGDASPGSFSSLSDAPVLRILVGMVASGSVTASEHKNFVGISRRFERAVEVRYAHPELLPLIHTKLYSITTDSVPTDGFIGSANFTNSGLGLNGLFQENLMTDADPKQSLDYFQNLYKSSISCTDRSARDLFNFPKYKSTSLGQNNDHSVVNDNIIESHHFHLFSERNKAAYAPGAGINWGISTVNRSRSSPDEAYLSIPARVSRSGFFPKRNVPFSVTCDDGEELLLRGASGNLASHPSGKDLSSLPSNAALGRYIRKRLGVASGTFVDLNVLHNYGKSYVTISKLSDGTYYLEM